MRNQIAQCGTASGYQRHLKYRETTCEPCRLAHQEKSLENKSKRTQPRYIARKAFLASKVA